MKKHFPNLKLALYLTPAFFLMSMWILILSSSTVIQTAGVFVLMLYGLAISFGSALAAAGFSSELMQRNKK